MTDVKIVIDGRPLAVPPGTNVVDAANRLDIEVPIFCHHPRLAPVGMCRMCLVEVGVPRRDRATGELVTDEGGAPIIDFGPKPVTGCTTFAVEGMEVRTGTATVAAAREGILEFLLTSHPLDCPVCDKGGECPLQNLTIRYGPGRTRFPWQAKYHFPKPVPVGPLIALDRERCVLCARCIRFQEEIASDPVLDFENRGRGMEIVSVSDPPFASYFSGNTTDVCPVGALTTVDFRFEARAWEVVPRGGICVHCPVGCNVTYDVRGGSIKRVMPRVNDAVNEIWICDKGRFAHHFASSPDRLRTPLVRRDGELVPATWEEALATVHAGLAGLIDAHGADSIGGIAGDHLANEDAYLFGRLLRGVIGTNNVDHRPGVIRDDTVARLGPGPDTVIGALGAGNAVLLVGLDAEEEAPVLYLGLHKAARHGARILVAGGRGQKLDADGIALRWSTGGEADLLRALSSGGDSRAGSKPAKADLPAGVAINGEPTPRDDERAAISGELSPLDDARAIIAGADTLLVIYGREAERLGLVPVLASLVAGAGNVGARAHGLVAAGPHANSQGVADMGLLPDWLPGYAPVADAAGRARLGQAWSRTPAETPGLSAAEMLGGGVKGLIVAGTDPAADSVEWASALDQLELVVVQELFLTETASRAHVVLPACSAAERDGTFTSMLRRVQRFYTAQPPAGESRPDWRISADLATLFGVSEPYRSAADVFAEVARVVPAYEGLSYAGLGPEIEPAPGTVMLPFAPQTSAREVQYEGTVYANRWGEGRAWPTLSANGAGSTRGAGSTSGAGSSRGAGSTSGAGSGGGAGSKSGAGSAGGSASGPRPVAANRPAADHGSGTGSPGHAEPPADQGSGTRSPGQAEPPGPPTPAPPTPTPLTLVGAPRLYDGGTMLSATLALAPLVPGPTAEINPAEAARRGLTEGTRVRVRAGGGSFEAELRIGADIPEGIVVLPIVTADAARFAESASGEQATLDTVS